MMTTKTKSRTAALAAAGTVLGTAGVLGAPGVANASADGCTFGPNSTQVCVDVNGWGKLVLSSEAAINTFINPDTLCRTQSKWTYRRNGVPGVKYSSYREGCVWLRAWFNWDANREFDDGSKFCATTRANVTDDRFPSAACVKIKA